MGNRSDFQTPSSQTCGPQAKRRWISIPLTRQRSLCHACCCCYDGCVPEVHHIGCAAQKTVLCLECDLCCKMGSPCLCCGCCAFRCVELTTCCKAQSQFCCCVAGSALPPDDEVPCMVNMCFLNCFPRIGCCMRLGDMKRKEMPWGSESTTD